MKQSFTSKGHSFSLGPFIKCPHPEMIEACGLAQFDFVVVDMEHTPLGPRDLYPLVLAAERRQIDIVVRIPEKMEMYIKWCLDLGVKLIQIPHIQSKADAERIREHSYFSPQGNRGLCRFVRAAEFSTLPQNEYREHAQQETQIILQVEGKAGLENIDEILEVPGIHLLLIGPYDLSQSLGYPGDIWNPVVVDAMTSLVQKCALKKMKVGTFTDTPEGILFWAKQGVSVIQYASDLNLFFSSVEILRKHIESS